MNEEKNNTGGVFSEIREIQVKDDLKATFKRFANKAKNADDVTKISNIGLLDFHVENEYGEGFLGTLRIAVSNPIIAMPQQYKDEQSGEWKDRKIAEALKDVKFRREISNIMAEELGISVSITEEG